MRSIMIFTANQIFGCLIGENEMGGACGTFWGEEKPEGKRLLGRLKCMRKDGIKIESKKSAGSA
jgi:hypothetical protein